MSILSMAATTAHDGEIGALCGRRVAASNFVATTARVERARDAHPRPGQSASMWTQPARPVGAAAAEERMEILTR